MSSRSAAAAVTTSSRLFQPLQLGTIGRLQHRVVLAPLTRNRAAEPSLAPSPLAVQYYRQRASRGGLLITEATNVSPEAMAYPSVPGIWDSSEQLQGWRRVTDAVHERGGFIVCQLWHTGRVAHPSFAQHPAALAYSKKQNHDYVPGVSASAVPIVNRRGERGITATYSSTNRDEFGKHEVPRPLCSQNDIPRLLRDYQNAAQNAKDAGFDGIELHAAHGYLIDQFLNDGVNQRMDGYGGTLENRCRLLREVLNALLQVWPSQKIGVRLSPHEGCSDKPKSAAYTFYGCKDSNPDAIYTHAVQTLNKYDLAYLFLTEPRWVGKYDASPETDPGFQLPLPNMYKFRQHYDGTLMGAGGFTPDSSYEIMKLNTNHHHHNDAPKDYDALAFGRWFLSNPDLPERLKAYHDHKAHEGKSTPPKLNRYDRDTFYTHGSDGYVDYPSIDFETTNPANSKPEFDGMVSGKFPLVDQNSVGFSLKETTKLTSKL